MGSFFDPFGGTGSGSGGGGHGGVRKGRTFKPRYIRFVHIRQQPAFQNRCRRKP